MHTINVHIAEADWGLVIENLNGTPMTWRDFYVRLNLMDEMGRPFLWAIPPLTTDSPRPLLNTTFNYALTDGKVSDVWVAHEFSSSVIPDGYWEFQATAFNRFDEPGNVWCLRTRVESKADAPDGSVNGLDMGATADFYGVLVVLGETTLKGTCSTHGALLTSGTLLKTRVTVASPNSATSTRSSRTSTASAC